MNEIPVSVLDNASLYLKSNFKKMKSSHEFKQYINELIQKHNLNIDEVTLARMILTYSHEVTMFGLNKHKQDFDNLFQT